MRHSTNVASGKAGNLRDLYCRIAGIDGQFSRERNRDVVQFHYASASCWLRNCDVAVTAQPVNDDTPNDSIRIGYSGRHGRMRKHF